MMETALLYARCAAGLFAFIALFGLILTAVLGMFQRILCARRATRRDRPPVSVVIPVKQFEEAFVAAQESVFSQDYPEFDVTATAKETHSPAVAAARAICAAHPARASKIVRSTAVFAASPKINNLAEAVEAAAHDVIFMKDSNIILPPDGLAAAISCLKEDVGMVVAVPQAQGAASFPAEIEASIMNQSHGRLLAAAAALGLGFGVGKLMVFRKSDLLRAGGFQTVAHSVGEDSAMAHAFAKLGLKTTFMAPPILQILGARGFRDVFNRQLRWTAIRRHNEIIPFLIEPFGLVTCAAAAAAFAAPLWGGSAAWAALAVAILWFAVETMLALARGWDVSMTAPLVMIARDAMMLAIWFYAWFTRKVVWASETYDVNWDLAAQDRASQAQAVKGKDL